MGADYTARITLEEIDNINWVLASLIKEWPDDAISTGHVVQDQASSLTRVTCTSICGYGKLMPLASKSRLIRSSTSQ